MLYDDQLFHRSLGRSTRGCPIHCGSSSRRPSAMKVIERNLVTVVALSDRPEWLPHGAPRGWHGESWRFVTKPRYRGLAPVVVWHRVTPDTPRACKGSCGSLLVLSLGLAGRRGPRRGSRLCRCRSRRSPGHSAKWVPVGTTARWQVAAFEGEPRTARTLAHSGRVAIRCVPVERERERERAVQVDTGSAQSSTVVRCGLWLERAHPQTPCRRSRGPTARLRGRSVPAQYGAHPPRPPGSRG